MLTLHFLFGFAEIHLAWQKATHRVYNLSATCLFVAQNYLATPAGQAECQPNATPFARRTFLGASKIFE